jgi:hypothetical protein
MVHYSVTPGGVTISSCSSDVNNEEPEGPRAILSIRDSDSGWTGQDWSDRPLSLSSLDSGYIEVGLPGLLKL